MIEYTGPLKGEIVEDKIVSARDLINEFELPINPAKQEKVRFTLDSSKVTINMADGRERFGESKMYKPYIVGSHEGHNCSIRYYTNKIRKGNNRNPDYTPKRIYYIGRTHTLRTPDHLEEAVMFMLHPSCGDSPFKKRNGRVDYRLDNQLERAQKDLQSERILSDIRDEILKATDEWVTQIALGINLVHKMIDPDHARNPIMARVAILELAGKNLNFVVQCLDSVQIKAAGIAAKAIENKQIRLAATGGGRRAWYYGDKYGGGEICKVSPKIDARQALMSHLSMPDERNQFLKGLKLESAEDLRGLGKPVGEKVDESDPGAMIDWAHEMGLINLHPGEMKVYQVEDGQFTGRSFFTAATTDGWKKEMKENTNKVMVNRLKKLVRNA